MTYQEEGQIKIHTENIFPIIKKAVYSDHEIFIRELISNSVDAISKRRMASLAGDCQEADVSNVIVKIDKEKKSLQISDNGIGMSADEIKKYINQVAFSSAEEFLDKYKDSPDGFIGHFGLGFYSSFMVASNVEIITKSAIDTTKAYKWSCDGSPKFNLEETTREEIGTDVILYLMEEEAEYLEPSRIKTLISKYCDFMPVDIQFEGESVNKRDPAWRKNSKDLSDQDYIDLYKYLYPYQGDPLMWIHLNTDYPYTLQGILYFPKIVGRADWEKGEIKLFCNQVFVSDSIKEVVPRYLLPLRGVIDSPDIPLNVSRSALQTDRKVRSIGNFISKKVSDRLKEIKSENKEYYAQIWDAIAPFIKIGAMEDEKFADQVQDLMIFNTTKEFNENDLSNSDNELIKTNNKSFTTIKGYIHRLNGDNKKVLYTTDEVSQANALNLWISQSAEVLKLDTVIDTQFIPWLEERNKDITFQRVDSELDDTLKEELPELSDKEGTTTSETIKNIFIESLDNEKITVQVQSLKGNDAPPALILLPEQMRRINDIGALMEQKLPGLPDFHVLVINKKHPLVEGLEKIKKGSIIIGSNIKNDETNLSLQIARHIYEMAKLSIGGLEIQEISAFQNRTADLMAKLMKKSL